MREIEFNFANIIESEARETVKLLNEKSSESLEMLKFHVCKGNVLDDLRLPFEKVSELLLSSSSTETFAFSENRRLATFFPKVKKLSLPETDSSIWSFLDGEFFSLISIEMKSPNENGVDDSHIDNFFKINPRIETLKLREANLKLLNRAKIIPNLKFLNIESMSEDYLNYQSDAIHFDTVTNVTIQSYDQIPEKIHFNQLKELFLDITTEFNENWIEFISKQVNPGLNTFILFNKNLKIDNLLAISDKLTKLQTFLVRDNEPTNEFIAEDIVEFVMKCKDLDTFEIVIGMEKTEQNDLKRILSGIFVVDLTQVATARDKDMVKINIKR